MFSFLNTSILTGLLAVSIPLLIHLLTRKKVKKQDFSTLYFLKELKTQKIRRIKIQQILLMIIRSLIILFLILAFARPTMKGRLSPAIGNQAKTSAVIIVDNSMSMGKMIQGRPGFDLLQERIRTLKDIFKDGDELFAITVAPGAPGVFPDARYQFSQVEKAIHGMKVSEHATDLTGAMIKAAELLKKATNINRELYIFSDLQRSGVSVPDNELSASFEQMGVRVYVVPITSEGTSNLGIVDVALHKQIIEKGKVVNIEVTVRNTGATEERNKLIQLFVNSKRIAQATVQLKPGEQQRISFKTIPDQSGLVTGSVLLDDDDLTADNRYYFIFYVPDQVDVLLVGHSVEDTRFLKIATDISPNIKSREVNADELTSGSFESQDVVILSNVVSLSDGVRQELMHFVKRGGGLIILPGPDIDIPYYNTMLNEPLGLPKYVNLIGDPEKRQSYLTFGIIDYSHPIFQGMFDKKQGAIDSPFLYAELGMEKRTSVETIIELSNRSPFLLETSLENGRILLINTAVNGYWSDFSIKAIFVPLINRSTLYLSGATDRMDRQRLVGEQIEFPLLNRADVANLEIEKPDGTRNRLKPDVKNSVYQVSFTDTDQSGFYYILSNESQIDKWAVNTPANEAVFDVIDVDALKMIIGKDQMTILKKDEPIADAVLTSRYGRELWKYALWIALILIFIEITVAREGRIDKLVQHKQRLEAV